MESRNWEAYYRKLLTDHSIPFQSYEKITKDEAEICGLAVNLADVMKRIPETCKKNTYFCRCADCSLRVYMPYQKRLFVFVCKSDTDAGKEQISCG